MTPKLWAGVGIAAGIAGSMLVGAIEHSFARPQPVERVAITAEDVGAVRGELREIQSETNRRFEALDQRLSHVEGYLKAKSESAQ